MAPIWHPQDTVVLTYPRQCLLFVQTLLCCEGTLAVTVGQKGTACQHTHTHMLIKAPLVTARAS